MADVFISYKSERRAAAQHLARVLELHGFSVWFDYGLYSGRDFGRQIERELRAAQAVIVLWCKLSVDSEWVFAEAYKAKEMEKLLTTQIEAANIPVPFNIADTIDLAKWDGAPRSDALDRLLAEITRLVGRDPLPQFNGLKAYHEQWRGLGALAMAKLPLTAKVAETEISPGAASLAALGEEAQLLEQQAAQAAEARKNAEDQRRALEARIAEAKAAAQAEADQRRAAEAEALALQEELQRPVIAPPPPPAPQPPPPPPRPPAPPPRLLPPSAAPRVDEQPGFLRRYAPWAAWAAALALLGVIVINNSGERPERPPIDQPAIDPADAAAKAKADDDAFAIAQAANTVTAFQAYLNRYANGRNDAAARAAIGRLQAPPPAPAAAAPFLDARSTPATTRAPLIAVDPATLPDFALFRECDACPEMVVMPAGSFRMGSPDGPNGEAGRYTDEGPQQNISLRRFAIARFETIWAEWEACVAAGACAQGPVDKAGGDNGWGRNRRPVIEVNWGDAGAYAAYIARAAGKGGYRRPTEAEWEYAARGGTTSAYPWGAAADHAYANYGEDQCCEGLARGRDQWVNTAPVGQFPANPFGLYDMHGNVWEWVEDCYRDNLNAQPANGSAYTTQGCSIRVLRGGSWSSNPQYLRSANRGRNTPTYRSTNLGFRLARTL